METLSTDKQSINNKLNKSNKNTCLYFFEALACCLIVFIHCSFPGDFGIFMNALARFGVPLFFAISGFYLFKEDADKLYIRKKLKKRIVKISILLLFSFFIYFFLGLFDSCFGNNPITILEYLADIFSWKNVILLLICNDPLTHVVNWFMIAQLFSYLIIFLFPNAFIKKDLLIYIISSLTIFWIIFRTIVISTNIEVFGINLSAEYLYRSWYANGLPFICFGIFLRKKQKLLNSIPELIIWLILFLSILVMIAEHFLFTKLFGQGISYYFGSIGCVFSIFSLSVKKPKLFSNKILLNMNGSWTTFVYLFHVALISFVNLLFSKIGINGVIIDWIKPIIVLIVSFTTALLFNFLVEKIEKKYKG